MEYDITLKSLLSDDNLVLKREVEFSLEYIQCKLTQCYTGKKYTHFEYEQCKEKCMEKLNKFNLLREILYQDFTKFYYNRFLECSKISEIDKFENCIAENKSAMKRNVEDIKKIVLNYNF
jgi:hypothetical protein